MGTLYIDKGGYEIRLDGNSIAFYLNGRRDGVVPVNPLKRVIIAGRCSVDTKVFHRLAEMGVQVVMLTGRALHFRCIVQGRLHNNGIIRFRQYERASDPEFTISVSTQLVNRKIENQIRLLEEAITERPDCRKPLFEGIGRLLQIKEKILTIRPHIDSLRGYEGTASSAYFTAYSSLFPGSLGFSGRNRRPPRDPVNAMLSLCYTLLYGEITTEIYIAGLDPTIGFYHGFEYGRDSLSCDIQEPFRPEVDRFVWKLFREGIFTKRDFISEKGGVYLKKKSRSGFYPCYEAFAREMRKGIQKTLRNLIERLLNEKDTLSM